MTRRNAAPASSVLTDGDVRVFHPEMAALIGLTEAIVLQQLYYWLVRIRRERDGNWWVYNTYQDWQDQLPWLSVSTLRRAFAALEDTHGLILTANYNRNPLDKTRWYAINFERLREYEERALAAGVARAEAADKRKRRSDQNEHMDLSDWTDDESKLSTPLPEITPESTQGGSSTVPIDATLEERTDMRLYHARMQRERLERSRQGIADP